MACKVASGKGGGTVPSATRQTSSRHRVTPSLTLCYVATDFFPLVTDPTPPSISGLTFQIARGLIDSFFFFFESIFLSTFLLFFFFLLRFFLPSILRYTRGIVNGECELLFLYFSCCPDPIMLIVVFFACMYKCVMDHAIRLLYSLVAVVSSRQGEIFVAFRGPLCNLCGKIKKKKMYDTATLCYLKDYIYFLEKI